jgi:hypothetical protein
MTWIEEYVQLLYEKQQLAQRRRPPRASTDAHVTFACTR